MNQKISHCEILTDENEYVIILSEVIIVIKSVQKATKLLTILADSYGKPLTLGELSVTSLRKLFIKLSMLEKIRL